MRYAAVERTELCCLWAQAVDDDMRSQSLRLIWESGCESKTTAGITADGRFVQSRDYFGYLNSGAAFNASFVVLIDASHLSFLLS